MHHQCPCFRIRALEGIAQHSHGMASWKCFAFWFAKEGRKALPMHQKLLSEFLLELYWTKPQNNHILPRLSWRGISLNPTQESLVSGLAWRNRLSEALWEFKIPFLLSLCLMISNEKSWFLQYCFNIQELQPFM